MPIVLQESEEVQATSSAITIIFALRIQHAHEIPLSAWSMMVHAEEKLSKELAKYFNPGNEGHEKK